VLVDQAIGHSPGEDEEIIDLDSLPFHQIEPGSTENHRRTTLTDAGSNLESDVDEGRIGWI
jgi:hypothetical protein